MAHYDCCYGTEQVGTPLALLLLAGPVLHVVLLAQAFT